MKCIFCDSDITDPTKSTPSGFGGYQCPTCPHDTTLIYNQNNGSLIGFCLYVDSYRINTLLTVNYTYIQKLEDDDWKDVFEAYQLFDITPKTAKYWLDRLLNLRAFL